MASGSPVARRIIFGTHVVPTYSIEMEETSITKREFQTSPGVLGGTGIAALTATQGAVRDDNWISFSHPNAYWTDQDDRWDQQGETWSGVLSIGTSATDLASSSFDLGFLYIKNTGDTNNCLLSIQGNISSKYLIVIPPNGSVNLRGINSNDLKTDDVFVKSDSSTTTIECILGISP